MTVTKDDSDDNISRVPDKTDDQRLYESRYILYHSNVLDRKITKNKQRTSAWYYSALIIGVLDVLLIFHLQWNCVFVSKTEEKEARKFFRGILKELEFTVCFK